MDECHVFAGGATGHHAISRDVTLLGIRCEVSTVRRITSPRFWVVSGPPRLTRPGGGGGLRRVGGHDEAQAPCFC